MHNFTRMRAVATVLFTFAMALSIAGCVPASEPTDTASENVSGDCAGITTVVEFGDLGATTEQTCVETTQSMTALEVMTAAGVQITPSQKYGDAIVCRVNNLPAVDQKLSIPNDDSYTETCEEFGPVSASWSIWLNTGDGWAQAQEGISTQDVKPGERVALVWQQGDYTDMSEWLPPTV